MGRKILTMWIAPDISRKVRTLTLHHTVIKLTILALLTGAIAITSLFITFTARHKAMKKKVVALEGLKAENKKQQVVGPFSKQAIEFFKVLSQSDESYGQQQFLLYHDGRGFRIRPFGTSGTYLLQKSPLPDGSLWVARGNIIQPLPRFSPDALAWLEDLINWDAPESDFQRFFEADVHPTLFL